MNIPIKELKKSAHHLKPIVLLGSKGLTSAVVQEADNALEAHELIKIKLQPFDKEERAVIVHELCTQLHAHLIQQIGHIITLYRKKKSLD